VIETHFTHVHLLVILHEYKYCTIIYVKKKIGFWCYWFVQFTTQISNGVEFHNLNVVVTHFKM